MVIAFIIALFLIIILFDAIVCLLLVMGGHLHDEESWRNELDDDNENFIDNNKNE